MQKEILTYSSPDTATGPVSTKKEIADYRAILEEYGLIYKKEGDYLAVGEITWTQGWIFHISVVITQLPDLIQLLVPLLIRDDIPFKMIKDREAARSVLHGRCGYVILGKVICIYPPAEQRLSLADTLIKITASFKGPHILTDRQLGTVLYTRYGAGNPVTILSESGAEAEYIYDADGSLIKDVHAIPFRLPEKINWPFGEITTAMPIKLVSTLPNKYKTMSILKTDAKGNVVKALWLKNWYKVKWCVIKEGRYCMDGDDSGRDMKDRLSWQAALHQDLYGKVPVPAIYDLFEENGDVFLVMEYIEGQALDNVVTALFRENIWWELALPDRLRLLDYCDQLLQIIGQMHQHGYIHRDINPGNFLVSKEGKLWMIDLELSFSAMRQEPYPPFLLGTSGFMSPEQEAQKSPSFDQDIYSIGGTLLAILTGLLPGKFSIGNREALYKQLNFFMEDSVLAGILCDCLASKPALRPSLGLLKESLHTFREHQMAERPEKRDQQPVGPLRQDLIAPLIIQAIRGLATKALAGEGHLWLSRTIEEETLAYYQTESMTVYGGFGEGLSGILFVLAKAYEAGFSISSCQKGYAKSLDYLSGRYLPGSTQIPAGWYAGTAGIAMALAEGVKSGLIGDKAAAMNDMTIYLENEHTTGWSLLKGISGRCMGLLQSSSLPDNDPLRQLLDVQLDKLVALQQKDGSWITLTNDNRKMLKVTGLGHGVAGAVTLLLQYLKKYPGRKDVEQAARKGLAWLIKQGNKRNKSIIWHYHSSSKDYSANLLEGNAGIAVAFIKAYGLLGDTTYHAIAEKAFRNYPLHPTTRNITQAQGLTGIGEVCLAASKALQSDEWQERADWIAQFLLYHNLQQKDGSCLWLADENPFPTAGFLTGHSGMIHFLLNYYANGQPGHPLFGD